MNKIQNAQELERKKKIKSALFSWIILGILLVSSLGYAFILALENGNNGNSINKVDSVIIGNSSYQLTYPRNQVSNITVNNYLTIGNYAGKVLYIDSLDTSSESEIANTLGRYALRVQEACYMNCTGDLVEKSCSDYLIVVRQNATNGVHQQQNCIFIDGDLKSTDAFLYNIFG